MEITGGLSLRGNTKGSSKINSLILGDAVNCISSVPTAFFRISGS